METTPYAGLVTRAIALIVDAAVINVIALITGAVLALIGSLLGVGDLGIAAALTGGFVWLGWTGLYFIVFWITTGQTPGARLLGLCVVSADPRPLGIVRAGVRFVVMMLALIPLGAGFLTVLFDDRRRGPHDMAAATVARWASPALDLAFAAATDPVTATASGSAPIAATTPPSTASAAPATTPPPTASAAPATTPPPAASAAPATTPAAPPRPTPVVGEVVGPAGDDPADGRVPPAARQWPRAATDQPSSTRFERRPGA
jgi:uncharacterized RDD family membrane protein YckC